MRAMERLSAKADDPDDEIEWADCEGSSAC